MQTPWWQGRIREVAPEVNIDFQSEHDRAAYPERVRAIIKACHSMQKKATRSKSRQLLDLPESFKFRDGTNVPLETVLLEVRYYLRDMVNDGFAIVDADTHTIALYPSKGW